jgi:hypothetical protein
LQRTSPSSHAWDEWEVWGNTVVSVYVGETGDLIKFWRVLTETAVFHLFMRPWFYLHFIYFTNFLFLIHARVLLGFPIKDILSQAWVSWNISRIQYVHW